MNLVSAYLRDFTLILAWIYAVPSTFLLFLRGLCVITGVKYEVSNPALRSSVVLSVALFSWAIIVLSRFMGT